MTTIRCEIVPVELTPHPNADQLSITHAFGYPVIVRTDDWRDKAIGCYIPVDALVPNDDPQFSFLEGHNRIRARKLRGIFSQGLLIDAPPGSQIGDDVTELLRVTKYEPPEPGYSGGHTHGTFTEGATPPSIDVPKYTDIEHLRRYADVFEPDELVVVTEKIHGASGKWLWYDDQLHVGSMNQWRRDDGNPWWKVVTPEFLEFVKSVSPCVVYGEVYGSVQDLKYGHTNGAVSLRLFDVYEPHRGVYADWDDWTTWASFYGLPSSMIVPVIVRCPFNLEQIMKLAELDSLVGPIGHISEGIVVKPTIERWDHRVGRVILKLHSQRYLLRRGA